ncbi:MAG: Crp/Fnr family transcriptional regulator [Cyclobacteriaceae bacterium]|nr:Crp/Fnr family transcriptional regulator [Cyclobacteriaceae bacterium]
MKSNMMYDSIKYASLLKSSFDNYFNAPQEAWEDFAEKCEVVAFKKDEIIKPQNSTEKYFYFIINGSVGIFLWKQNNFVCLDFAFNGHFCADYMSILTKQPTPLQVIALENSQMLRMTSKDYDLITQQPIGKVLRLVAAEMSFVSKQLQQIELLTKSAKDRYKILLEQFPDIQNRIAQNHIASYLGITPQSLSRIRSQQ